MAEDVKPTRKNLMAIDDRIQLSERGHDTLEQKRDGLIMEFMDILDQAQDVRADLNTNYETAQQKLNMARAMEGDVAVRGAAAALEDYPEITTRSKNIMGVVVPQIESSRVKKSLDQRGYGLLGSSARIDEAADAYEELIETIILAAEVETAMKKCSKRLKLRSVESMHWNSSFCQISMKIKSISSRSSKNRNVKRFSDSRKSRTKKKLRKKRKSKKKTSLKQPMKLLFKRRQTINPVPNTVSKY